MSDAQIRKLWAEINKLSKRVEELEKRIDELQSQSSNSIALANALNMSRQTESKVSPDWRPYLRQDTKNIVIQFAKQHNVNPSAVVNNIVEQAMKQLMSKEAKWVYKM